MDKTKDSYSSDSTFINETEQKNAVKNMKYFSDNNDVHETSAMSKSSFNKIVSNQLNVNSQVNQLFKVPNLDKLPLKKATVKSIKSPSGRFKAGRIINEFKTSQPKVSLIPRPSFINSSKSLHCSRSSQLNARKELIKKMVFLAECTLKENQLNQSTPVKRLAGLTPKKTPRSGGYFVLPEFKKKVSKLEEIRSPIEDLIKKEMFSYSKKSLNEKTPVKSYESKTCDSNSINKEEISFVVESLSETKTRLSQVLNHCKLYSMEVTAVHEKLRSLDETFETKLNQIPEYKIYNEFCVYQLKKEELYRDLKIIEDEFKNSLSTKMEASNKLKTLIKKKEECFEKQKSLLKDFEQAVQITVEKYNGMEREVGRIEETINEATPKLRRSLRLSKVSKKNEKTPITKKLKKLDNKSKGIQKSGRL